MRLCLCHIILASLLVLASVTRSDGANLNDLSVPSDVSYAYYILDYKKIRL